MGCKATSLCNCPAPIGQGLQGERSLIYTAMYGIVRMYSFLRRSNAKKQYKRLTFYDFMSHLYEGIALIVIKFMIGVSTD